MHPRRSRGSQLGREKRRDESFQVRAEERLGDWTISKDSSGCRLITGHKKRFVPNRRTHLLSSFRAFVHDGYCLDHGLSGSCTKEMHAVRKLSVWYKIPIWFQNTVCPKTKASAYNIVFTLASATSCVNIFIGGFHAVSGDTNNIAEMNKCWWTNKPS